MITLKEFKKLIKEAGYKYKTYISGYYNKHRFLQILDKENNFICGAGANVYTQETINQYKEAFNLINTYKDKVYDKEGDKVLF